MATNKPILSVIVDRRLRNKLEKYAKERKTSLSKIAAYFIQRGIECEKNTIEDLGISILDLFPELIWIKDASLRYKYANKKFLEFFDISSFSKIKDKLDLDFLDEETAKTCLYGDMLVVNTKSSFEGVEILYKNEYKYYLEVNKIPIFDKENNFVGILGIARDITHEMALREKLRETTEKLDKFIKDSSSLCNTDFLTNLPNRIKFINIVSKELKSEGEFLEPSYLLLIDIYNFKFFNKIYGIEIGNEYIKKVSQELLNFFQNLDIRYEIGRIGDDTFSIFIKGEVDIDDITGKVKNIIENIYIKDSYGKIIKVPEVLIVFCKVLPDKHLNVNNILIQLDIELSNQKNLHKKYSFYNFSSNPVARNCENHSILYNVVESGNIVPYVQGIYSVKDNSLLGYEVLFRVRNKGQLIEAKDFIFTAYSTGLILSIDKLILKNINEVKSKINTKLFLNISYVSVYHCETTSNELVDLLINLRDKASFEISESEFIENLKIIKKIANKYNLNMIFDNFGEYHCPIKLVVDIYENTHTPLLKFDKDLINSIIFDKKNEAIVKAIVDFTKGFGIETIAVGVENNQIYEKIKSIGIDYCQGYFLEEPKSIKNILVA